MLKKFGTEIAKKFAISFFFVSLTIVLFSCLFQNKVDLMISLIQKVTIVSNSTPREISFDTVQKKLKTYPNYGDIWATLKIPDISLELPIYHGDTLDLLRYGVGHYAGSYFPSEGSSIVLAGHSDRGFFMRIPELKIGQKITIEATYGTFVYQVIDAKIIRETDTASLPIQKEKELLMMYTCYPVNSLGHKTERYVVYAELVGATYAN